MTTAATTSAWVPPEPGFHAIIGPEGVGKTRVLHRLPGGALERTKFTAFSETKMTVQVQDLVRDWMRLAFPQEAFPGYEWWRDMPTRSPGMRQFFAVLTAVIMRPAGTIAAWDNPDAGMSPRAIRALFAAMRNFRMRAMEDVTFVFTTQSVAVLNEYNNRGDEEREGPEHVWIIRARGDAPQRLTDLMDRDRLAQHDLGELYARDTFSVTTRKAAT